MGKKSLEARTRMLEEDSQLAPTPRVAAMLTNNSQKSVFVAPDSSVLMADGGSLPVREATVLTSCSAC